MGSRVARRLPGRHSSVAARPLRCRSGFSCGAQCLGKAATLVPSRWSFARRLTLDTSLEQYVERLSHDRTTEGHWQRLGSHRATVPKEVPRAIPAHPRQPTPRLLGQLLCDYHQSLPLVTGRPGWDGGTLAGSSPAPYSVRRRHRRIAPTAQYWRRCARRLGLVRPRDPSWCPVTPSFGRRPWWPSAGLLVGGSVTPGKPGCSLPLRGHRGPGPVRASVSCPGSSRTGVTPAVHHRGRAELAASPMPPVSVGSRHPRT